jgi:hypothetical protein
MRRNHMWLLVGLGLMVAGWIAWNALVVETDLNP